MRRKVIILFFIGLLLMGLGGGISFAEFTSLRYGGEKSLTGDMTVVSIKKNAPVDTEKIYIETEWHDLRYIEVEADSSLPKGQIALEVTCDEQAVSPYLEEQKGASESEGEAVYTMGYRYHYGSDSELKTFMEVKDEMLSGLKKRVIYSFSTEDVQKAVIKVSPELVDRIIIGRPGIVTEQ